MAFMQNCFSLSPNCSPKCKPISSWFLPLRGLWTSHSHLITVAPLIIMRGWPLMSLFSLIAGELFFSFLAISQVPLHFVLVHPSSWPHRWIPLSKTIRCETKDQTHPRVMQNTFLSPCLSPPLVWIIPNSSCLCMEITPGRPFFMLWLPLVVWVVLSAPLLSVPPRKLLLVGIVFFFFKALRGPRCFLFL